MKFSRSLEWHQQMAALEAEYDVCAGRQIFPMSQPPQPTPPVKPKKTRKPKASKASGASRGGPRRPAATKSKSASEN